MFGRKALLTPGRWSPNKAAARPSLASPSLMLFLPVSNNWLFQSTCSGVPRIQLKKYYTSPFIACSCCSPGRGICTPRFTCLTQNCLAHRQREMCSAENQNIKILKLVLEILEWYDSVFGLPSSNHQLSIVRCLTKKYLNLWNARQLCLHGNED